MDTAKAAPACILVVDDNPANLQMLFQLIEKGVGGKLLVAKNGETALAIVGKTKPDLILLDYHLPDLSGVEFLAELRDEREGGGAGLGRALRGRGGGLDLGGRGRREHRRGIRARGSRAPRGKGRDRGAR